MKRALKWVLINGIFAIPIYFGFVEDIENARRVALFLVWFLAVMSFGYLSEDIAKQLQEKGRSVPTWIDVGFDLAVIFTLVWYGAIASGVAYLFHFMLHNAAFSQGKKQVNHGG